MDKIKTNTATIPGDIPARIVKQSSAILSTAMVNMINQSIKSGSWPYQYKLELITPVGKQLPVELLQQLRPISNLPICNKIQEACISESIISYIKMGRTQLSLGTKRIQVSNITWYHFYTEL